MRHGAAKRMIRCWSFVLFLAFGAVACGTSDSVPDGEKTASGLQGQEDEASVADSTPATLDGDCSDPPPEAPIFTDEEVETNCTNEAFFAPESGGPIENPTDGMNTFALEELPFNCEMETQGQYYPLHIERVVNGPDQNYNAELVYHPILDRFYLVDVVGRDVVMRWRDANASAGSPWHEKEIDCRAFYPHLAIDGNGDMHLLYVDMVRQFVVYATNQGGSWRKEALPHGQGGISQDALDNFPGMDIIVDAVNRPHIAYRYTDATYAFRDEAGWHWDSYADTFYYEEHIHGYFHFALNPKMAIDGRGRVHIIDTYLFHGYRGKDSVYTVRENGVWSPLRRLRATDECTPESSEDTPRAAPSLIKDSRGTVYAFYAGANGPRLGREVGGRWLSLPVGPPGVDVKPLMALDADDRMHIFASNTYRTGTCGQWQDSHLDETLPDTKLSIAVATASDRPHVVIAGMRDPERPRLHLVTIAEDVFVESIGEDLIPRPLGVVHDGVQLHVLSAVGNSLVDTHRQNLVTVGQDVIQSVPDGDWRIGLPSTAVDDGGTTYLAYRVEPYHAASEFELAEFDGQGWSRRTVDLGDGIVQIDDAPALAMDEDGDLVGVVMAELAGDNADGELALLYLQSTDSGWTAQVIQDDQDDLTVLRRPGLVLAPDGEMWVSTAHYVEDVGKNRWYAYTRVYRLTDGVWQPVDLPSTDEYYSCIEPGEGGSCSRKGALWRSLALDQFGGIHVATDFKFYSSRMGGYVPFEAWDPVTTFEFYPRILVDSKGDVLKVISGRGETSTLWISHFAMVSELYPDGLGTIFGDWIGVFNDPEMTLAELDDNDDLHMVYLVNDSIQHYFVDR